VLPNQHVTMTQNNRVGMRGTGSHSNWPKTGRNAPCPCGGGKKFKKCHGSVEAEAAPKSAQPLLPSDELLRTILAQKEAEHHQRQQQQGLGRPILSFEVNGLRVVCVCNRAFHSLRGLCESLSTGVHTFQSQRIDSVRYRIAAAFDVLGAVASISFEKSTLFSGVLSKRPLGTGKKVG